MQKLFSTAPSRLPQVLCVLTPLFLAVVLAVVTLVTAKNQIKTIKTIRKTQTTTKSLSTHLAQLEAHLAHVLQRIEAQRFDEVLKIHGHMVRDMDALMRLLSTYPMKSGQKREKDGEQRGQARDKVASLKKDVTMLKELTQEFIGQAQIGSADLHHTMDHLFKSNIQPSLAHMGGQVQSLMKDMDHAMDKRLTDMEDAILTGSMASIVCLLVAMGLTVFSGKKRLGSKKNREVITETVKAPSVSQQDGICPTQEAPSGEANPYSLLIKASSSHPSR